MELVQEEINLKEEYTTLLHEKLIRGCRENPSQFIQYVLSWGIPDWIPMGNMHIRWQDTLSYGGNRILLLSSRDHSKTSFVAIGRILWELGKNKNLRIKLVCQSDDTAIKRLSAITDNIERNPRLKEVFPELVPSNKGTWSRTKILVNRDIVSPDPSIEAVGILSTATGGRSDLLCFHKNTEILTENGWKKFYELSSGEAVATLNKREELEFQVPTNYIKKLYQGELLTCNTEQVNFAVTPEHNVYARKRSKENFELCSINTVYSKSHIEFKKNCDWIGEKIENIIIPEYVTSQINPNSKNKRIYYTFPEKKYNAKDFMSFLGFYVAEGDVSSRHVGHPSTIRIGQNSGEVFEEFKQTLNRLNIIYKVTVKKGFESLRIHDCRLANYLVQFGMGAENKKVPIFFKNLSKELLLEFYKWYKLGDGTVNKHGSWTMSTVSKKLCNDLHEIGLKCGTILREYEILPQYKKNTKYLCKLGYGLSENNFKQTPVIRNTNVWGKLLYDDYVYCVSVPNHIIYTRYNKSSLWMGNCFDDPVDFRNAIEQPALRNTVKEVYNNVWVNILEPDGRIWVIATPWHQDDMLHMLLENKLYTKIIDKIDDDFTPIWPEKWNREALVARCEEIGNRAFARAFKMEALSDEEAIFNEVMLRGCETHDFSYGEWPNVGKPTFLMGVDLGSARKSKEANYTVIFTGAVIGNKKIPINITRGKFKSPEFASIFYDLVKLYNPSYVVIENNASQEAVIQWVREKYGDDFSMPPIKGYFTGSQKMSEEVGLPAMAVEMEQKSWVLPEFHKLGCKCGYCIWLDELKNFPLGKFSDTVMASWLFREGVREYLGHAPRILLMKDDEESPTKGLTEQQLIDRKMAKLATLDDLTHKLEEDYDD